MRFEAYLRLYRDQLAGNSGKPELSAQRYTALARFVLAGIDGLNLQELVKPSRRRSARTVEALIYSSKQLAQQLMREAE